MDYLLEDGTFEQNMLSMPGFELFGDKEKKQVHDVLDSGVLMRYGFDGMRRGHWKTQELEASLKSRMQVEYAHVVSSGTAALTVALISAGIGAGDEVIMPTFTFVASFESILALGAVPVLVDVDDTLTLDPKAVEKAITQKTKVVMPVHMCGSMADLDTLKALCKKIMYCYLKMPVRLLAAPIMVNLWGALGIWAVFPLTM